MTGDELETQRQLTLAYKVTFASQTGKLVVEDLSKVLGEFAMSFSAENPYQTAYNEGTRSAMRYIRRKMNENTDELKATEAITEGSTNG